MKLLKIFSLVLLSSFIYSFTASAQQDSIVLNNIINKTKRLGEEQPIEKVYLHFDKPYYAVADTMWFKAYLTVAENVPSPFSKIVYVELLNEKDSLVQIVKLPVKNSVAYGNIPISMQNFKQGNYYVRAYTRWMINFDAAYFFTKNILIGEAIDKELITHISYTNEELDKNIKTTAKIQFRDINKNIYANKAVTWAIVSNYDVVSRGKGVTDQNGFLTISVNNKAEQAITNGSIVTTINTSDKETAVASFDLKQIPNHTDVQFFPEGGNFLIGIPNQVGFKVVNSSGLGVDVKGSIIDEANVEITTLSTSHAGMGSFYLTPQDGKSYKAKLTFKDGSSKLYDLPKANPSGVTLQVMNANSEFINLRVIASQAYYDANQGKSFFILGTNDNMIRYAAKISLNNQLAIFKIPKVNFPSGIAQLTLFDENSKPLSERLAFILHNNNINLSLKTDLATYKPRQKVKVSLKALQDSLAIAGDFSVTVTDEQKVPTDENSETTIFSSLLLSSNLKGYIEKPNYYFLKTDDKKLADLDKLMLTQGYRRFLFQDILADQYPTVSYLPEQGINISGTLRDLTGMPIKKGALRLMVTDKPISAETLSSNSGLFNFQNLVFPDSSEVVVSARYNANAANLMIMLDGMPFPAIGKNKNIFDEVKNIDTVLSAYLNNSQKQYRYLHTLKEVVIKGAATPKVSHKDHSALVGLSAMADHIVDGSNFSDCNFLLDCIKLRATGMTYYEEKFYITRDFNAGSRTPVQVFWNNNPIDAIAINSINRAEIESVEIFLKDELGTVDRLYGTKGVLLINTRKAPKGTKMSKQDIMDMFPKKNTITFNPMGYSKEREFYSPKYLPNAAITSSDLRTTIYWNPKVLTDETGNYNFEFFNSDGKGTYRIVIEGFDKNGHIGRGVYRYTVK